MGFCQPDLVGEPACDRLPVGIGRNVVALRAALGKLGHLTAGKLLKRGERLFVLGSLAVDLLTWMLPARLAQPV